MSGDLSIGSDMRARRKNPYENLDLLTKQIKSGDFTSNFSKIGTKIGNMLGTGQLRPENQSAAGSL